MKHDRAVTMSLAVVPIGSYVAAGVYRATSVCHVHPLSQHPELPLAGLTEHASQT